MAKILFQMNHGREFFLLGSPHYLKKERIILNPHKNCKESTRKIVVKNLASEKSATFGFVCDKELMPIKSSIGWLARENC